MIGEQLAHVGGNDSGRINNRISQTVGLFHLLLTNPDGIQAKSRIPSFYALQCPENLSRVNCHISVVIDISLASTNPH